MKESIKLKLNKKIIGLGLVMMLVFGLVIPSQPIEAATTLTTYTKDTKNNKLSVSHYKVANNQKFLTKTDFYYNIFNKKKIYQTKIFATKYYNKGRLTSTKYHSEQAKRAAIVYYAKQQLGRPYRSGGSSPKGFDCSGLTSYVYKTTLNQKIGRASYNQVKQGKFKSFATMKPGDILFWGSKARPYHVGIYIGNGKYIHAETPGTKINIKTFKYFKPSFVKSMI